jgi:hypothetical protein
LWSYRGDDDEPLRLLHRDLKPGNLQITQTGTVKVLDFGVARAEFDNREMMTTNNIGGTIGYIAPERLQGIDGPAGDIWSLGVVLEEQPAEGALVELCPNQRARRERQQANALARPPEREHEKPRAAIAIEPRIKDVLVVVDLRLVARLRLDDGDWLAFLLAADLPLPEGIFVKGYLPVDGKKIARSGDGFAIDPVVQRYGIDALRWYFARHCRTRGDSDVTLDAIAACHDRDLADRVGNLAYRTATLARKVGRTPTDVRVAHELPARIDEALDRFAVDEAAGAILDVVDEANRYLDRVAPWKLPPREAAAALDPVCDAIHVVAGELAPFVPRTAQLVADAVPVKRLR